MPAVLLLRLASHYIAMIDINVAPEQIRRKRRARSARFAKINIPKEALVGLVGGLFVLLFVVHVVLQAIIIVKWMRYKRYDARVSAMTDDKKRIDKVLEELRVLQSKKRAVEQVTTEERISWAHKLNDISDSIPRGVWLSRLLLEENVLLIEGSAVSKAQREVISIGNFTSELKKRPSFMANIDSLNVGSIQSRMIKTVEVADFLITARVQ